MMTWANLEGLTLGPPLIDDRESDLARDIRTIEAVQAAGYVDASWRPMDLLVLLFGVARAWVQSPHPDAATADPAVIAARRVGSYGTLAHRSSCGLGHNTPVPRYLRPITGLAGLTTRRGGVLRP